MALLLMMIMVSVSSCGAMFADTQSTILAASYLSKPKEIDAADLQFTRLELDLQKEIDRVETDNPGYDEYSYNLGAIGHNPFTLISYLSAVHTEFTASEVESEIQALFDEMYELTLTPDTETRTRTVTKTGTETTIDLVKRNAPDTPIVYVVNGTNRFKATKEFMEFFKEEHKDEPIYCLPQSEAFVQSRLANQSVVAYNPRLPAALATSVLTHGVWKILKLKF